MSRTIVSQGYEIDLDAMRKPDLRDLAWSMSGELDTVTAQLIDTRGELGRLRERHRDHLSATDREIKLLREQLGTDPIGVNLTLRKELAKTIEEATDLRQQLQQEVQKNRELDAQVSGLRGAITRQTEQFRSYAQDSHNRLRFEVESAEGLSETIQSLTDDLAKQDEALEDIAGILLRLKGMDGQEHQSPVFDQVPEGVSIAEYLRTLQDEQSGEAREPSLEYQRREEGAPTARLLIDAAVPPSSYARQAEDHAPRLMDAVPPVDFTPTPAGNHARLVPAILASVASALNYPNAVILSGPDPGARYAFMEQGQADPDGETSSFRVSRFYGPVKSASVEIPDGIAFQAGLDVVSDQYWEQIFLGTVFETVHGATMEFEVVDNGVCPQAARA